MKVTQWSRWDQIGLEGLLWVLPGVALLQVVVELVRAVRGDEVTTSGQVPDALVTAAEPVSGPLSGTVLVSDPTVAQYAWDLAPAVVLLVVAVAAARLLLGVVRSLRQGDPFSSGNARRLASLSVVVVVGGIGYVLVESVAHARTIAPLLPDGPTTWEVDLPLMWPALVGGFVAFLAEVFARGARLREDIEGLV